jgi:phosphoribosylglycinamide formyltransferase-1
MRVVIFASGTGSNAETLLDWSIKTSDFQVLAVFCNRPDAGVIQRCAHRGLPCIVFTKSDMNTAGRLKEWVMAFEPNLIVLAGFLWKFPDDLIQAVRGKAINLHPALLPKYGGKGMFGMHVHEAVCASTDVHSGISIHWVNEEYDSGAVLFQFSLPVPEGRNPMELAQGIHELEHYWLPRVVSFLSVKSSP